MNWLASLCMQFAGWLLRRESGEWSRAMRAEFQYVNASDRLSWAFGCVVAAIKQRLVPMDTGDFRIARWVMLIETLGCFGPLTVAWSLFNFYQPGIVRYNFAFLGAAILPQDGGVWLASMLIAGVFVGLVGPIGLYLGLRYVLTGRALQSRALGTVLVSVPLLMTAVGMVTGLLFGPSDFKPGLDAATVTFVFLPVFAFAHLMFLARPAAPAPPQLATA